MINLFTVSAFVSLLTTSGFLCAVFVFTALMSAVILRLVEDVFSGG